MTDYKRLTFIFLFTTILLLSTDSSTEKHIRTNLMSLFNIVAEESSQVTDSAPTNILETFESSRIGIYSFLSTSADTLKQKSEDNQGILSFALNISTYVIYFLKFVSSYIITFYPFIMFVLYLFFTSSFFKKDEFGYEKF